MAQLDKYGELLEEKACPKCGISIKDNWVACPECGYSLKYICSECGRKLEDAWKICPYCESVINKDSKSAHLGDKKDKPPAGEYRELERICHIAITISEEVLLGLERCDRTYSDDECEHAPFAPESFSKWKKSAELGIPDGMCLYGAWLEQKGNARGARMWLEKAVSNGCLIAKRYLADFLINSGEKEKGLRLYHEAIDEGDANAAYMLSMCYEEGDGVPKSIKKYKYFRDKAISLGNKHAKFSKECDDFER